MYANGNDDRTSVCFSNGSGEQVFRHPGSNDQVLSQVQPTVYKSTRHTADVALNSLVEWQVLKIIKSCNNATLVISPKDSSLWIGLPIAPLHRTSMRKEVKKINSLTGQFANGDNVTTKKKKKS